MVYRWELYSIVNVSCSQNQISYQVNLKIKAVGVQLVLIINQQLLF